LLPALPCETTRLAALAAIPEGSWKFIWQSPTQPRGKTREGDGRLRSVDGEDRDDGGPTMPCRGLRAYRLLPCPAGADAETSEPSACWPSRVPSASTAKPGVAAASCRLFGSIEPEGDLQVDLTGAHVVERQGIGRGLRDLPEEMRSRRTKRSGSTPRPPPPFGTRRSVLPKTKYFAENPRLAARYEQDYLAGNARSGKRSGFWLAPRAGKIAE
jgi:hypothetical protein